MLAATPALTVGDVLKQAGVELRDSDKVTPQVSERVRGRSVITVTRAVPIELTVDGSKVALRSTGPMVCLLYTSQIKAFRTWLLPLLGRICTYKNKGGQGYDKQGIKKKEFFRSDKET